MRYNPSQISEHDAEHAATLVQVRKCRQEHERAVRLGDGDTAARLADSLVMLRELAYYEHNQWLRRGAWQRFYQVRSGAMHLTTRCRTINEHTVLRFRPDLSGQAVDAVALVYKVCSHCIRKMERR